MRRFEVSVGERLDLRRYLPSGVVLADGTAIVSLDELTDLLGSLPPSVRVVVITGEWVES